MRYIPHGILFLELLPMILDMVVVFREHISFLLHFQKAAFMGVTCEEEEEESGVSIGN